jgi:hypothetical protein
MEQNFILFVYSELPSVDWKHRFIDYIYDPDLYLFFRTFFIVIVINGFLGRRDLVSFQQRGAIISMIGVASITTTT